MTRERGGGVVTEGTRKAAREERHEVPGANVETPMEGEGGRWGGGRWGGGGHAREALKSDRVAFSGGREDKAAACLCPALQSHRGRRTLDMPTDSVNVQMCDRSVLFPVSLLVSLPTSSVRTHESRLPCRRRVLSKGGALHPRPKVKAHTHQHQVTHSREGTCPPLLFSSKTRTCFASMALWRARTSDRGRPARCIIFKSLFRRSPLPLTP